MSPSVLRKTFRVTTSSVMLTVLGAMSIAAMPSALAAADDNVKTATPIKDGITSADDMSGYAR